MGFTKRRGAGGKTKVEEAWMYQHVAFSHSWSVEYTICTIRLRLMGLKGIKIYILRKKGVQKGKMIDKEKIPWKLKKREEA